MIEKLKGLLREAKCPNKNCSDGRVFGYDPAGDLRNAPCQWCADREEAINSDLIAENERLRGQVGAVEDAYKEIADNVNGEWIGTVSQEKRSTMLWTARRFKQALNTGGGDG